MRIDSQFEKVAKEHSMANAVFSPKEGYLSYKELDELSDEIADNLRLLPDAIIGVSIERSFSLIITILGIMKSNKAYLPLDFSYPEDRVSHMLSDSKVDSVICSRKTEGVFRSQNKKIILYDELLGIRSTKKKHSEKRDLDVAYVLYTSGSTGKPRGVVINHKSIMNTIKWRIEYYSLNGSDRVLQIPSISFDSSVEDIFCTLLSGGMLCLISEDDLYNVKYLSSLIIKEKITHFICVPSFYRLLLPEIPKQCSLRFVVLAGEPLDTVLVRQHYSCLPNVSLYNEYGPSENSVCSTVYLCKAEDENVPIGKTISNVDYLILSDGEDESYGELLLGGEGLSNGYINNIEYTRERFKTINGKRYYKTGDFVKLLPSGNLLFCGRQDQQIKKMG